MGIQARIESMQRPALWDPIQHDQASRLGQCGQILETLKGPHRQSSANYRS